MAKKALILVDLQQDFCPGGSLAVSGGNEVIPLANALQKHFALVVATQDWHPADHMSFAINHPKHAVGETMEIDGMAQVMWPAHCIQGTAGADFHPALETQHIHRIFHKGTNPRIDSYSAFYDNAHMRSTGLGEYLRSEQVTDVYLMGLATDYCVKFSALDAAREGFCVHVIRDGCRSVELTPGDTEKAYAEMRTAGIKIIDSALFNK